jgi:DNA-binding MarR family transcriptional regulator
LEPINMSTNASDCYQIVWLVRRLFRALGQKSNEGLQKFGISAADRAVLEFLYPDEELSVPDIAARYQVSRQHVQVTVNTLLDGKLLTTKDNPRHKRSPLISLTAKGRNLFSRIKEQDYKTVEKLFSAISAKERHTTQKTLETLLAQLR